MDNNTNVNATNEQTTSENATVNVQNSDEKIVFVVNGAGTEPIQVPWEEGMTVSMALKAAEVELEDGETPVIGEAMISDPDTTPVEAGQMIVIDNMPANG